MTLQSSRLISSSPDCWYPQMHSTDSVLHSGPSVERDREREVGKVARQRRNEGGKVCRPRAKREREGWEGNKREAGLDGESLREWERNGQRLRWKKRESRPCCRLKNFTAVSDFYPFYQLSRSFVHPCRDFHTSVNLRHSLRPSGVQIYRCISIN